MRRAIEILMVQREEIVRAREAIRPYMRTESDPFAGLRSTFSEVESELSEAIEALEAIQAQRRRGKGEAAQAPTPAAGAPPRKRGRPRKPAATMVGALAVQASAADAVERATLRLGFENGALAADEVPVTE